MALRVADRAAPSGALVRTLTLSRPERRNALDAPTMHALIAAVREAARAGVRVLVVTGEGPAFCAGYDLGAGDLTHTDEELPDALVGRTMAAVRAAPMPVVARVNGAAYGAGLELAISCDLRVAASGAPLCLPPARIGVAYAPAGLARLMALAGTAVARRLVFTAEPLSAEAALQVGLVDEVVPAAALDEAVQKLVDGIAGNAPRALAAMKQTLDALEPALGRTAAAAAREARRACFESEDVAEGLAAFAARRPPKFTGR